MLKNFISIFMYFLLISTLYAQKDLHYTISLEGIVSSEEELPFFMSANQYDRIPNNDTFGTIAGIYMPFSTDEKFDFSFTGSFSAYGGNDSKTQINELFGSVKFGQFFAELGLKYSDIEYGGLSITNGSFSKSLNARAYPGFNIKTNDFKQVSNWLGIKGNYGEFFLNDPRYTENTMLHNKSLHFRFYPAKHWSFNFGLDHFAQWAGDSPEWGKLPASFNDYLRVVFAQKGGEDTNDNERINVLGNHLGSHLFQINYDKDIAFNLYWSHPFEDNSGLSLKNTKDGLFGIFVDLKKPTGFVSKLLFEYVNTLDQGQAKSSAGFVDNYFNNSVYRSGWTYHNSIIGLPLFRVTDKEWLDVPYQSADTNYSRMTSYHFGISGFISDHFSYKGLLNYTYYPGWFNAPQDKDQLAGLLTLNYTNSKLPFLISSSIAADFGSATTEPFGFSLKLTSQGIF